MMRHHGYGFLLLLPFLLLTGCDEDVAPKAIAQPLTIDAIGYYCNMTVIEHPGPKGQIHRADGQAPLWFSSVRDAVAYTMLPDEPKDIVAIFVHDMGGGRDWSNPSDDGWIDAHGAWYVIGSRRRGGMGIAEAVPFAAKGDAMAFALTHGGRIVDWPSIPQDYILNTTDKLPNHPAGAQGHSQGGHQDKSHDGPENKIQEHKHAG